MSRDIGRPDQIALIYTVPSQENEYLHAHMVSVAANPVGGGSSGGGNINIDMVANVSADSNANTHKRRRSSESFDEEEDDEEEDEGDDGDDGEYMPGRENSSYGATHSRSHTANPNYGPNGQPQPLQSQSQSQRRSPGEPYELSIPPHDPSASTSGLTVPSMSTSTATGAQGSGSATATDNRPGSGSGVKKGGSGKSAMHGQDGLPPPKKKRRRQALSCTECKRRKIRCDRVQPCAPCTRRGEADKCKWNILEPVEKFVTRREYDEIKDSLNRLENFLTTNPGSSASTTEEVAAAVNMVKSKAVLLSKVVASPQPGPPPPHLSSRTSPSLNPHASLSSMSGAVSGATNNSVSLNPNPSLNLNMNMGLNPNPNNNPNSNHPNSMMLSSNVKGLNDLDSSAATAAAVARVGMLVGTGSAGTNASNLAATASGGGGTNATFAFSPFNLNVPSQSHPQSHPITHHGHGHSHGRAPGHSHPHLSPQSDEDFYRTNRAGSVSHSASSSFSRSQSHLPSSSHMQNSYPSASTAPNASPHYGHFSSGMTTDPISGQTYGTSAAGHPGHPGHQQRPPSIDMGGFVVEGQSGSAGSGAGLMLRPESASSLSTLATVANASAMQNLHGMRRAEGRSPMNPPQTIPLQPVNMNTMTAFSAFSNISPMITPTSLPMDSKAVREAEMRRLMNGCFPRKEVCDQLVEFYFEKIEWSIALLHRPTFMRAYQAFWFTSEDERVKLPDLNSASGANGANSASQEDGLTPAWIALFASLLCVSFERMGAYDTKTIGIVTGLEDFKVQSRKLYDATQAFLILSDFIRRRSLEAIQALVLQLHCQQTIGVTAWEMQINGTLTLAVRLAIMMGLNKLSAEKPGAMPPHGLLKRELGRRAWWNLVERDWMSASRVGYTYVVNPLQNFADYPANVEWEEMERGRNVLLQRSRDIWTTVSSLTAKLEIARINRELIDQYNTHEGVSYSIILNFADRLNEAVAQSPSVLSQVDDEFEGANELARWNRLEFTFYFNSMIIRLYRPYFVTALVGSRSQKRGGRNYSASTPAMYSESIYACVRAAEAILDTVEEAKASSYPGIQWWDTTMHCYTAAVTLLIDRWYSTHPKPDESIDQEDAEERRRKIVAAIALMKDQAESIGIFCPAAIALDVLLDATSSARRRFRKNPRRGMDLNDVVNPINVSSRSSNDLPSFVKEWIEVQMDDNGASNSNDSSTITTAPSLSTINLLPEMALVADTTPDSAFWSRLYDAEFGQCANLQQLFFPTIQIESDSLMTGVVQDQAQGGVGSVGQQYLEGPSAGVGSNGEGLGASAIWSAMSGPIGSMAAGDAWARSTPYESATRGAA